MYQRLTPQDRTAMAEHIVELFVSMNIHPGDAVITLTTALWIFDRENNVSIETSVDLYRKGLTILHRSEDARCQTQ